MKIDGPYYVSPHGGSNTGWLVRGPRYVAEYRTLDEAEDACERANARYCRNHLADDYSPTRRFDAALCRQPSRSREPFAATAAWAAIFFAGLVAVVVLLHHL